MKEFNYEQAKEGAPVCTRDGRPARIICWDYKEYDRSETDEKFPIIALVDCYVGERAYLYRENGTTSDKKKDLFMAPVKQEGWINICKDEYGMPVTIARIWKSEESARNAANGDESYIATIKIEWEE